MREILRKMRFTPLASREEIIKVEAVDDISSLQEYVIAIPKCDNVANLNSCPGMNGRVVEPELDLLLILMAKTHFRQNCCTENKMRPLEPTLNFKHGGLVVVLSKYINISTKTAAKEWGISYLLPCINDDVALGFLDVCNTLSICCPSLFLPSLLTRVVLSENSSHL